VPAIGGVVEVHGDGGTRHQVVRVVARSALLDHGAAHLGARVVEVQRQDVVGRGRLGHAPRFLGRSNADAAYYKIKTVPIKQFPVPPKGSTRVLEHYQSTARQSPCKKGNLYSFSMNEMKRNKEKSRGKEIRIGTSNQQRQ